MYLSFRAKTEVPEQLYSSLVTVVIDAVPEEWKGVKAWLHAPGKLVRSGDVDTNAKWVFASTITQVIQRMKPRTGPEVSNFDPDILGLLIGERKLPLEVSIGDSFMPNEILTSRDARRLIHHLIERGYNGRFSFKPHSDVEERRERQTKCEIWIPHEGAHAFIPQFIVEHEGDEHTEVGSILRALNSISSFLKGDVSEIGYYLTAAPVCGA